MRGGPILKTPVTPETPVTGPSGYRPKSEGLQGLHRLQVKNSKLENDAIPAVIAPQTDLPEAIRDAIEERAALCADAIPAIYLDAWARLNHQKPMRVSDADWRRALDDGGRFLDAWGREAAEWGWTAGELFDVPREGQVGGLIWFLAGERVAAFGPEYARTEGGRFFERTAGF